MALFRKFFYKKPPDGLLEIAERVYVFDCCFSTDVLDEDMYRSYMGGIVKQLGEQFPDSFYMVFNFREGERRSQLIDILSEYDMIVMDYPRQYEGCPLICLEMIHHFLRSSESWLSLEGQHNVLLMHCERGGWPVLAFMLAGLLIYRKQYSGEQKTLDMIYKQAPRELLQLLSPLNPLPSQLRYLNYISRRNVGSTWPPADRALTLDCVILRDIPNFNGEGGCRPLFRVYGQDTFSSTNRSTKVLFSVSKKIKNLRLYRQEDCELVKVDIRCHVQGDVVLECINLDEDMQREEMMFRVMFNTSFIRSNILMLNRDEIDILWDAKDRFPKDFRAEILLSDMDTGSTFSTVDATGVEEKEGLPMEAFDNAQEIFNSVDWLDEKGDAAVCMPSQTKPSNVFQQKLDKNVAKNNLETQDGVKKLKPDVHQEKTFHPLEETPKRYEAAPSRTKSDMEQSCDLSTSSSRSKDLSQSPLEEHTADKNTQVTADKNTQVSSASLKTSVFSASLDGDRDYSQKKPGTDADLSYMHQSALSPSFPPVTVYSSKASGSGIVPSLQSTPTSMAGSQPPPPPPPPPPYAPVAPNLTISGSSGVTVALSISQAPSSVSLLPSVTDHGSIPPSPSSQSPLERQHTQAVLDATYSPSTPSPFVTKTCTPVPPPPPPFPLKPTEKVSQIPPPSPPPVTKMSVIAANAPPPPPPPPLTSKTFSTTRVMAIATSPSPPPPPPPLTSKASSATRVVTMTSDPPPPPPPPPLTSKASSATSVVANPPPPPPPPLTSKASSTGAAPPPPPPPRSASASSKQQGASPQMGAPSSSMSGAKGRGVARAPSPMLRPTQTSKKTSLKPLHWVKVTRAMQGSLWAESQKQDEAIKPPEFDMSELESLFSVAAPASEQGSVGEKARRRHSVGHKPDKIHLIDLRRANNCEIMLTKVKMPLSDLMSAVLALDDSILDVDQVDNLIKFCPTKEEMELLKGYGGNAESLGKCEQFFLELMKVPRVESKLRVFSFKIQFYSQVSDLRKNLNIVNSAAEEIKNSIKLKMIMQTILSLGNALNQGTARGSAIGFRLDSLLKLTDTRARNNKMTLMHYLCKVLADKLPELLDFPKDLISLEAASKKRCKLLVKA
ncbi:formin-like protein 6 isoform X2 [Nymphaea colorata]|uniref:formin-like protein 6 isoform X2 n=1 Tax=Nymphaea colorata TaxID=210225 RepID=UPI00129E6F14|nr:formin-like protein 6 isoform X2 [Nymphaea colorata]